MSLTERILGLAGMVQYMMGHNPDTIAWLHRYGYLADLDAKDRVTAVRMVSGAIGRAIEFHFLRQMQFDSVQDAVVMLQSFVSRPRCGHSDTPQAVKSNPWTAAGISTVRVGFSNYLTAGLSRADQRDLTDLALKSWTAVCALKAELVEDSKSAHVVIACMPQNESDGPGGTLMYTYLPTGRQTPLFVDTRDKWARDADKGLPYRNSMAHEFGHILCGLTHSSPNDSKRSLMDPYLDKGVAVPQAEDIERAVAFWGPREATPVPAPTPAPTPAPPAGDRTQFTIRFEDGELTLRTRRLSIDGHRITKVDAREGSAE